MIGRWRTLLRRDRRARRARNLGRAGDNLGEISTVARP
jgi:hypothetical protein